MVKPWRLITASDDAEGSRLDVWLTIVLKGVSRQRAKRMINEGGVTVNGVLAPKGAVLQSGDRIAILGPPEPEVWYAAPDDSERLEVHFADEDLIAVEKPSGLPSVPLHAAEVGTLAGWVVHRFPECRKIQRSLGDGGLVQRLDRDTSGVVLAARSRVIHEALITAQTEGAIEKVYLALVDSEDAPPQTIDLPLIAAGRGRRRMKPSPSGPSAHTRVAVRERYEGRWLVEVTIHRGVRHQIRAHLAGVGCPIAGDGLYGRQARHPEPGRLFLHAHRVILRHPRSHEWLTITSPLPDDLERFLDSL